MQFLESNMPVGAISGENMLMTGNVSASMNTLNNFSAGLAWQSQQVSQDAAQQTAANGSPKPNVSPTQVNDPAFLSLTNTNGFSHYAQFNGGFLYNAGGVNYPGTMSASIDADFANDKIAGSLGGANPSINSYVEINVPDVGLQNHCDLPAQSFQSVGPASLQWTNVLGTNGGSFNVSVALQDVGTPNGPQIAEQAKVVASYSDSGGAGTGDMIAPIAPGPTDTPPGSGQIIA